MASTPQPAYLVTPAGANLYFECILSEKTDYGADISEHPVEQGSDITDHVRVKLQECTLSALVTQSPTDPRIAQRVQVVRTVAINTAQNQYGSFTGYELPTPNDFIGQTEALLKQLMESAALLTVVRPSRVMNNMAITSIGISNDDVSTARIFAIGLREVRLVTTQLVAAPVPTNPNNGKVQPRGAVDPTPTSTPPPSSVLAKLVGL